MIKNQYFGIIQKDNIGDIIDIFTLTDEDSSKLESFKQDGDYIVLPLKDAIAFSKSNPRKKFFVYNETKEVIDILKKWYIREVNNNNKVSSLL